MLFVSPFLIPVRRVTALKSSSSSGIEVEFGYNYFKFGAFQLLNW